MFRIKYRSAAPKPALAERDKLISFMKDHCVVRSTQELLLSPSGRRIDWLVDTRIALLNSQMALCIAALYWELLRDIKPFQLACMELTGVPLMVAIQTYGAMHGEMINSFIVRKERKRTGRQNQIEGIITDAPVIFVDDVMNSGNSLLKAAAILDGYDVSIRYAIALVDFDSREVNSRLAKMGIGSKSILHLNELGLEKISTHQEEDELEPLFRRKWRHSLATGSYFYEAPKSVPVVDDKNVYFGSDNGVLWCLDQVSGATVWSFGVPCLGDKGIWSTAAVTDSAVYFGGYDGNLYALDKYSGQPLWEYHFADWIGSSPCISSQQNMLFIGLEHAHYLKKGSLLGIDLTSGISRWEFVTRGMIHATPLYDRDRGCVFIGTDDGMFYAIDASTGREIWSLSGCGAIRSIPTIDRVRDTVLFGSFDHCIYALQASTGKITWKTVLQGAVYSQPLLVDDQVFIACTDKRLYILDVETGLVMKRVEAHAKLFATPVRVGDNVYIASTAGCVYRYSLITKRVDGLQNFSERITTSLVHSLANDIYFIATIDNSLHALVNAL
ncbi:PQQ-binding-like beta-propeller repeat protein [Granulicella sp. WH15]|uniref:outer membrane protein assembly factor BamB family protein n=1 Tax=Granulicella sp. WH15 TaxID=2602070 RepID=UPI001366D044|nr:PQQ-binding-like beta-propeller repeat protein [Granulicella sp. WH15]QHN02768.1 PQQ-binding-like beta-propeller repeat protein [Granulicella sp. WH15]